MYKIIGADGRQYGPVSAAQIKQWIAEGRVESRTPVFTDGAENWTFAGLLPEFAGHFHSGPPPAIAPPERPAKTNSYAMAGFVFGILALVCCCKFLFGALGIVFSLIGLSQINRHPELYAGRGLAIAGLALSLTSLLLAVVLIAFALATGHFHYHWNFSRS